MKDILLTKEEFEQKKAESKDRRKIEDDFIEKHKYDSDEILLERVRERTKELGRPPKKQEVIGYYFDGVGWIPYEVTPGYMDDEFEKAAFSVMGETENIPEKTERPEINIIEEKERDKLKENGTSIETVLTAAAVVLGLLLILLSVYIINGRRRLKKALKRISEAGNKEAMVLQFGYAEMLLAKAKLTEAEALSLGREKAYVLNIEALFSEHEMTDEQRSKVDNYKNEVLLCCKNKWNFFEKIINRWLKFIY